MILKSSILKANRKKFYSSCIVMADRNRSGFKELTAKRPSVERGRLLPNTQIFPTKPGLYFSVEGKDENSGKYPDEPLSYERLKTIESGTRCYLNRGEIVCLSDLSFSNINNIDISAFGAGANPVLSGSTDISGAGWNNNGDGTYWTSLATEPKWVWINGTMARLAESAWIPITQASSTTVRRVAAATLAGFSSVVNAKIIFKEYDFRATKVGLITAGNTGTGDISFQPSMAVGYAAAGMALKIMNQAQFMTTQNDWWYDDANDKLFVKSTSSPSGTDIRITTGDVCMSLSNVANFTVTGVDFKHHFKNVFNVFSCASPSFTNLTMHDNRGGGVKIYGTSTGLVFDDNIVYNHGLRAVEFGGVVGASISRNTIHDIGTQDNIGHPYDFNQTGGTALTLMVNTTSPGGSSNFTIDQNTMYNLGYQGIQWLGPNSTIKRNIIHDYCLKWNDGGGIHTIYRTVFSSSTSGVLIQNNIIYNGVGDVTGTNHTVYAEGIYLDAGSAGNTVDKNTVYNTSNSGILLNFDTTGNTVTNNIVAGCANIQIWIRQHTDPTVSFIYQTNTGNVVTGNILACRGVNARCMNATSYQATDLYNPFSGGGNSDSNSYVQPYGLNVNSYTNVSTVTNYTLATWRTKMGLDAASTERTNYIAFSNSTNALQEVKLEVNATASAVNFNVPAGYTDKTGASFSNPVQILPYSSLPYFKNTAYP